MLSYIGKSYVFGPTQVSIKGKSIISPNCYIRGDLAPIWIGRYYFIDSGTIIRPSLVIEAKKDSTSDAHFHEIPATFIPLRLGNHTRIGKKCVIEAAGIGTSVCIGNHCVV